MNTRQSLQHEAHDKYMVTDTIAGLRRIERNINKLVRQVKLGRITENQAVKLL